jgi:sigma-B regulation protein RsbU (phosphoserine phosphatase)
MVGAFDGLEFETKEHTLEGPATVFVYSDGVFEVQRTDQTMWPFSEFVIYLGQQARVAGSAMDSLIEYLGSLSGKKGFEDDFSIVQIRIVPGIAGNAS